MFPVGMWQAVLWNSPLSSIEPLREVASMHQHASDDRTGTACE